MINNRKSARRHVCDGRQIHLCMPRVRPGFVHISLVKVVIFCWETALFRFCPLVVGLILRLGVLVKKLAGIGGISRSADIDGLKHSEFLKSFAPGSSESSLIDGLGTSESLEPFAPWRSESSLVDGLEFRTISL